MRRIEKSEVKTIRDKMRKAQGNKCVLCGLPFKVDDVPVLDHDHNTGIVRAVLHNTCNSAEGKARFAARRCHKGVDEYDFLISLGKYLEKHKKPRTPFIYPIHKTEEEKKKEKKAYMKKYRAKRKVVKKKK